MKIHLRIKILLIVLVSYFASLLLIKNIYLVNSPKIRPDLGLYLTSKVKNTFNRIGDSLAFLKFFNNNKTDDNSALVKELNKQPYQALSKGVYAQTEGRNALISIDSSQIDFIEYTFDVNGKIIIIKVPNDQLPPSQKVVEALYK